MADDDARWPAFFRHSLEPIFVLNRRRQIVFVNKAWETHAGVSSEVARGLICSRKATGHELASLVRTLVPPAEVMQGQFARARRSIPGAVAGPPWWDIDYLPVIGEGGVSAIVCRIRQSVPGPVQPHTQMPAAWAELRAKVQSSSSFATWESANPEMRLAVTQARFIAEASSHAFICGSSGTGKQTLARAIHAQSSRRELVFVALDCVRLPVDAVRGVLFGPRGVTRPDWLGMLYLNEPMSLPRDLQAELATTLRNIPQVLAGTESDPRSALAGGTLHPELFARLGVIVIQLPALRQRMEEIAGLVDLLTRRAAMALERGPRAISPSAAAAMHEYSWPGNLDELASVIFTAMRHTESSAPIESAELPSSVRQGPASATRKKVLPQLDQTLEQVERKLIKLALARAKGNKSKAADLLGVWRPRLLRRMETLGMKAKGADI